MDGSKLYNEAAVKDARWIQFSMAESVELLEPSMNL